MSKENTATVYGLDKGAYLINKQPQLINDRHLKKSFNVVKCILNTKEYTKYEHADVLFWTEIKDIEQLKFKVTHYTEIYNRREG